jgi:hypothetical protein
VGGGSERASTRSIRPKPGAGPKSNRHTALDARTPRRGGRPPNAGTRLHAPRASSRSGRHHSTKTPRHDHHSPEPAERVHARSDHCHTAPAAETPSPPCRRGATLQPARLPHQGVDEGPTATFLTNPSDYASGQLRQQRSAGERTGGGSG